MVTFVCAQHKLVSAALLDERVVTAGLSLARGLGYLQMYSKDSGGWAHQLSATASVYVLNNSHVPGQ